MPLVALINWWLWVTTAGCVVRGDVVVVGFTVGCGTQGGEAGMRSAAGLCLPPPVGAASWVLPVCGMPSYAPSRGQCWPWGVLLQSHMESSLQEAFIVPELFWLKCLRCSYSAVTCLQLISYLCNLQRKSTKCFSSTASLSFVHFIFPIPQRTPISLLALQYTSEVVQTWPKQCLPMNKQECWAHLDYKGEECVSPPPHTQSHRHFGQPTKKGFSLLSFPFRETLSIFIPLFPWHTHALESINVHCLYGSFL